MVMNVKPVPTLDERINDIRMRTAAIVNEHILPNEGRLWASRRDGSSDEQARKEAAELRTEIKGVINGHKWFTSNGIAADFFIVMCRVQDDTGELGRSGQMAQIIVPTDSPGLTIVRGIGIWGRDRSDHCEVVYENVRVPLDNMLG